MAHVVASEIRMIQSLQKSVRKSWWFKFAAASVLSLMFGRAEATDIRWFGNQSGELANGQVGSYFDSVNWEGFVVPQSPDYAFFGTGIETQEGYESLLPGTPPRTIYFGDATLTFPTEPDRFVPGGIAQLTNLSVQSYEWSFGFGAWNTPGGTTGNLQVTNVMAVGETMADSGAAGDASLRLFGPGTLTAHALFLAADPGATGSVEVDGSTLNSPLVIVGQLGTGYFDVTNGGEANASYFIIGGTENTDGEANIVGGSKLKSNNLITIGDAESTTGKLTVTGENSSVEGVIVSIGNFGNATFNVADEATANIFRLLVGGYGTSEGSMNVTAGGKVTVNEELYIGNGENAIGHVLVDGEGTELDSYFGYVGFNGTGDLSVANGATAKFSFLSAGVGEGGSGQINVTSGGKVEAVYYVSLGGNALYTDGTGDMLIDGEGSSVTTDAIIVGNGGRGGLTLSNGGSATANELVIGAIAGVEGRVTVNEGSSISVAEKVSLGNLGVLDLTLGGRVSVGDGSVEDVAEGTLHLHAGGELHGFGQIQGDVFNEAGLVGPGNSPGKILIEGDYVQALAGVLALEIGGTNPGEYDQLDVTGDFIVAGDIKLSLAGGYLPELGDHFELFFVDGDFDISQSNIYWTNLSPRFEYDSLFSGGVYSITITAVPEASTMVLCGLAMAAAAGHQLRRRRMAKQSS
ncbi:MAG: hypothetical protein U1D30_02265 [Planctomycetota bacterium]